MDFATRDRYRHALEKIAKRSRSVRRRGRAQGDPTWRARLQREVAATIAPAHVGFYLIDKGLPQLERAAQMRAFHRPRPCAESARRFPLLLYLGAIALITAILTGSLLAQAHAGGAPDWVLGADRHRSRCCATSQLAVALVNWLATLLVTPHPLPRMDFSEGIPPESRTLVVVPTHAHQRARTSRIWSRRWKSGSWPIGTSNCTSAC